MRRRDFISLLGSTALAWPSATTCLAAGPEETAPAPPTGKALVYLYRQDTWPEVRADALFTIGDTSVANLSANSYTWFYVPQGSQRLEQRWDLLRYSNAVQHKDFAARSGSTYYFRLSVEGEIRQMRWWISTIAAAAAILEIAKCRFQAPKDSDPWKGSPSEVLVGEQGAKDAIHDATEEESTAKRMFRSR